MSSLTITVTSRETDVGPYTLVQLAGEADVTTSELRDTLRAQAATEPQLLVIEMSALTFMDSSALQVIFQTRDALARRGSALALVSPSPAVSRLLTLVSADTVISVHTSLDAAIAQLSAGKDTC